MTDSSITNAIPAVDPKNIYVFISYARPDQPLAEQVEDYLYSKDIRVFRDTNDIPKGDRWINVIQVALVEADVMVLLMSKASNGREQVEKEWGYFDGLHKPIIPLYVEDVENTSINYQLFARNYIDARHGFAKALDELYVQLLRHIDSRDSKRKIVVDKPTAIKVAWSWSDLQRAFQEISRRQSGRLQNKYNKDIYIPRPLATQQIDAFLTSTYPALILVGKSGIGKSNFVLAEIEGRFANDPDKAVIVLDGGMLDTTDVIDFVVQRISQELGYTGVPLSGLAWLDWFTRTADFGGKQILIVIDAINENEHAIELTQSIDRWIEWLGQRDITNLKFMLTTPPQAWRNIQAGTGRLNDNLYYRPAATGLDTFDEEHTVELTPFDIESDLPLVYEKYRKLTGITTTFDQLSATVRELLCDPFALRIVMKTYGHRDYQFAIPHSISAHQIIEHYLNATQHSSEQPFSLLSEVLLPLMLDKSDYKNAVTRPDLLGDARTAPYAPVFFADALPGDASVDIRQARQELQKLIDAEILTVNRTGNNAAIRFTYERFYNYFAAKHLKKQLVGQDDATQNQTYVGWFNSLAQYPFLWGPLYILLLDEGQHGNMSILQAILQIEDVRARNLLTNVLIELGGDAANSTARDTVSALSQIALDQSQPSPSSTATDSGLSTIIAQVAESLRLKTIIAQGVLSTNPSVSDAMTDVLINLWVSPSPADVAAAIDTTWQVVNKLNLLRPKQFIAGFRNTVFVCLVVMMTKYRDMRNWPVLSGHLHKLLLAALRKIPGIQWLAPKTLAEDAGGMRQMLLQAAVNIVVYGAGRVDEEGQVLFDLSSAHSFFKLSPAQRQEYRLFVDNITAERSPRTLEQMQPLLQQRANEMQLLGGYMLALPVLGQIPGQASVVNTYVTRLLNDACDQFAPTLSRGSLTGSFMLSMHLVLLRNALRSDTAPGTEELRNFENALRRVEQQFWSTFKTTTSSLIWMDVATYYFFANQHEVEHRFELLREMVKGRSERNDVEALPRFIHDLAFVGTHQMYRAPQLALDLIRVALEELPLQTIKALRSTLIDELVLLRTGDEYKVEMFLQNMPDIWLDSEAKRQIRTRKPPHKIGERIGVAGSWFGRDVMFAESPQMRQYLQWFFYCAIDSTSVREWFGRVAGGVLHELFRASDPDALLALTRRDPTTP